MGGCPCFCSMLVGVRLRKLVFPVAGQRYPLGSVAGVSLSFSQHACCVRLVRLVVPITVS